MAELGSILLRRGTTEQRLQFVPLKGEIIYDTELKQVFVGDGETYGGRTVFDNKVIVDTDGSLKVGENLAVIVGDDGVARSLRLPGGSADVRPNPVQGALRFNTTDKTLEFSDGTEWYFLDKSAVGGNVIELHVSLDGRDDRKYGQQRGRSWGTAFRTLNAAMREAEDIVNASPQTETFVNTEQNILKVQILVKVASGIYEEQLPIRVPANTSIFGSGQRRTIVRPKIGEVSTSPWAKIRFWRETEQYPDGYFGYHYLTDPADQFSTPLDNQDIDIFLCNDTNWFHDFSTDLHSSFAFVLDPEGQILTKSPYPHTGACFPKSSYDINPYAVGFHGGIFADGFTGNQDFLIDSVNSNTEIVASGFWREPKMPTAFYLDGTRYQALNIVPSGNGEDAAAELLRLNKEFIAEETIQYVNDKYLFDYNEEKCRRDLNIILRNVGYDAILDTNFLTYFTSQAYLRPNSAYVLSDQNPQTAGGVNYAKGLANTSLTTHTPTQAKNTQLFNNIINTITNSRNDITEVAWPEKVYDDAKDSAKQLLTLNINFITQELLAWITYQINNDIAPFNNGYSYDQDKCRRDTELLINAVIFDILYEGNYATKEIGNSYWLGITSQVPEQKAQHGAAYSFLNTVIAKVLQNDENINWIDKYQLDVPQELISDIPAVTDAVIARAGELITIVEEVVQYGTNYAPITEYPNLDVLYANRPPLYKEELQNAINARSQLVQDTKTIIDSSIAFIDAAYASFNYDEATCRRDVGLIIDAMRHDLIYGGQIETVRAARSYFETGSTVIADQEAETVDAINYAKYLALNVVKNSVPESVFQTDIVQVQDSDLQSSLAIDDKIESLFGIITNLLTNYNSIKQAHDLLELNKEWIQDEVIAYINTTYPEPGFTYNQDLCRRDTGLIVSAISNDMFGGSTRSEEAGRSYYRGVSDLGDPSVAIGVQLTETLDANNYAKYLIDRVLNNQAPTVTYQSVTEQTIDTDVVVQESVKTKAAADYDIILDIMENGVSTGESKLPRYKINLSSETPIAGTAANRTTTMITAGNKSFVSTDWTQFGNLGYGVLARNNARVELVSIFTYYCGYTYKAESGSEIRSLNGSSSNGIYGLGAEGRNPFEVPIRATTLSETAYVAQADSSVVGDNLLGDLQIVTKNAVDVYGNPAEFFNVMVAEVDHGGTVGIVRYEIGNFQGNTLNIRGSAQGLVADIPDNNNINIRLLQEYKVSTTEDISDLLLGAALIYDNDPGTGYRIINIEPVGSDFKIRTIPTLNHKTGVANGNSLAGSSSISINNINYQPDEIIGHRLGYKGTLYIVTDYNKTTQELSLHIPLNDDIEDLTSFRLSPPPGEQGDIFTDFSVVKASNHDMLDVGTGSYEDSNYPRELYGPPTRKPVQSNEVKEFPPGRVFFVTNDQDGNFRVGDYFRVNQGDGSISFNAAIALSNLDGLGFSRGVTINEFSADSDMIDVSDEAVPTEQAVVNYINKRLGQDELGATVGETRLGAGVLMLDGSQPMEGDLDLDSNNINNIDTVNTTNSNTVDLSVTGTATVNDADITTLDVTTLSAESIQVDDISLNSNIITTTTANKNLELDANGTGKIVLQNPTDINAALTITANTSLTGNLDLNGNVDIAGSIIPTTDDTYDLGSPTKKWRDLYLGPGSLYINGTAAIQEDVNGNLTLSSANNKDLLISTPGTGVVKFQQSTQFDIDLTVLQNLDVNGNATIASAKLENLTAGRIPYAGTGGAIVDKNTLTFDATTDILTVTGRVDVDDVTINDNGITMRGNQIYATGSASLGHIYIIPGYGPTALGDVTIQGNLDVTGTVSTTDVGLGNTQINGNFTVLGNTDIGNALTDSFTVSAGVNSDLIPYADSSFDLGSIGVDGRSWANIYTDNIETDDLTIRRSGDISVFNSAATPVEVFSVDGATGNVVTTGQVIAKNNFKIQTSAGVDKFTVDAATGNTTIKGTLTVDNTVTINATTVTVDDPIFTLGGDTAPTSDDNLDRGIEFRWHNGTAARLGFFGFDDSTGKFTFIPNATNSSNTFSGTKGTVDANVEWADILSKPDPTLTINGDASGSATFTDVGDATLTLTISQSAGATNAEYINVDEKNDDVTYQVLFSAANGAGYQRPYIDTDNAHLTYNPSTHSLVVGNVTTTNAYVSGRLDIGGSAGASAGNDSEIRIYKADNNVSDHIQFYNGTTRVGEIGVEDTSWLRINQVTATNIYTPRYIRADNGFFVDGTAKGIDGSGNFIGGGTGTFGNITTGTIGATGNITTSGRVYAESSSTLASQGETRFNWASGANWTVGTGNGADTSTGGVFSTNGDGNLREYGLDPFGKRGIIWVSRNNDATSDADGGWNKTISGLIGTKSYMSVTYIKRVGTSTNGSFYHGCSGGTTSNLNGTNNTNPYFSSFGIGTLPQDVWCVSIGIIQANGDSNTTNVALGGLYRLDTGAKVTSYTTFKWRNATDTTQIHRTYLYYSTSSASELQWWGPGFYEINGNEPKLNDLLGFDNLTLGTQTTGNYVASITNGSYITGGNGGSEAAGLTLAVDAASSNTASKVVARDASGNFSAGTVTVGLLNHSTTATRDKVRVWDSSSYTIGMKNGYTFGAINNDYAMSFQMNNANNRGFWWGDTGHTDAQGAMALSTDGKLSVAHSARIGYGESDTTVPGASYRLDVSGNAQIAGTLTVTSTNALTTRNITTGAAATTGTITGTWSLGTGSKFQATYADVAEIYATDAEYEPGTVVMFGGDKELTIATGWATTKVAGVITTNPAFVMNQEAEGQAIALKGRIPVKVEGRVRKGDFIVASNTPGVGIATDKYIGGAVIGKSIADKDTEEVELIEVKV